MDATYYVAGIDVHKKMLAVGVANAGDRELQLECRRFGTTVSELRNLSAWLGERAVQEVVMESTAQYWKPVWLALEREFQLSRAQDRLSRCETLCEPIAERRFDFELCARHGATVLAYIDPHEISADARSGTAAKSTGKSSGRVSDQIIQCSQRSARSQWPAHSARHRSW